ncbi:MAG: GWxTD domain-containing protein [Acidobacteria bacterium]|jgi:GWxTD domain-containing protein|nr:GWxTD domain-containing protein [Acidobacteriota bacterium]
MSRRLLGWALLAVLALPACRTYRLEKRLDAEDREFLSVVRYIISGTERRLYLEMPKDERPAFIAEFWQRRDPDPGTEENEFKTEHLRRIEEATRLFTVGRPGWLSDRGKTYIVLGPPDLREKFERRGAGNPLGVTCEIWHYPGFPVVFVDPRENEDFQLHYLNLEHQMLVREEMLKILETGGRASHIDGRIVVVPAATGGWELRLTIGRGHLTFSEDSSGYRASLDMRLRIREMKTKKEVRRLDRIHVIAVARDSSPLALPERIEVPLALGELPSGRYMVSLTIADLAGGRRLAKSRVFAVK